MKVYNRGGNQYIAYNPNELVALATQTWRVGSNGRTYFKDVWDTNLYFEIIIKTDNGTKQLAIDEANPLDTLP